jgi:hypothetical protein
VELELDIRNKNFTSNIWNPFTNAVSRELRDGRASSVKEALHRLRGDKLFSPVIDFERVLAHQP